MNGTSKSPIPILRDVPERQDNDRQGRRELTNGIRKIEIED